MPLFWLSLALICGIWLADWLDLPLLAWMILAGVNLAWFGLGIWLGRRFTWLRFSVPTPSPDNFPPYPIPISLLLLAFCLGGLRYQVTQPHLDHASLAWYNDQQQPVIVRGIINAFPDQRDLATLVRVNVEEIRLAGMEPFTPVSGSVMARLPPGNTWHYGDRIEIEGTLETPPDQEDFSYRAYLARQGIYSQITQATATLLSSNQGNLFLQIIYQVKASALEIIFRLFPDPEASLLAGILLGVETFIPESVERAFQDTGTAHIIAISGFNMAIIAGLFATLFGRLFGKRRGAIAAVIGIVFYTLLVGAGASVVRAAIMAGLTLLAAQLGRKQTGLNTLAIVACVMALFNPNILWDVGFQLSFMATLGLVLYAGPMMELFSRLAGRWMPPNTASALAKGAGEYFLFTLAALLTTLPITLYHFQRFSMVTLIANPVVLPAQPLVMILGGLATIAGMIWYPLGRVIAFLAWPFVAYTIRMVELLAQLPGASWIVGRFGIVHVFLYYLVLLGLTFYLPHLMKQQPTVQSSSNRLTRIKLWIQQRFSVLGPVTLITLLVVVILTWKAALATPDGRLHLTILNTNNYGQSGEALLIQTPTGRSVLINGGPSAASLSDALGRRLPVGQRGFDFWVVAGIDNEQIAALPANIQRYPPDQVLWAGATGGTRAARQLNEALLEHKVPILPAQAGQALELGDGARLEVYSTDQRGAILLLKWQNFSVLLPLGMDMDTLEAAKKDNYLTGITALLLSGNGYAPANPAEWIDRLQPQVVLLSVAGGDQRNLPDSETLEAVEGYTLLRTDQNGWIELTMEGEQMWVEVERK